MKKITVILISIVLIILFGALVYYGLRHSRGIPTFVEKVERTVLEVPFLDEKITLEKGIYLDIWKNLPQTEIKLMYQVMVLPWPKVVIPTISVKAFHNKEDIYFLLTWSDDTQDEVLKPNKFSDACAIMFPLGENQQPSSLMMGFMGKANIWQCKASQNREFWKANANEEQAYSDYYYPFEEKELFGVSKTIPKSAANSLVAIRVGTVMPVESHNIEARGYFSERKWRVVFKRSLKALDPENDTVFVLGKKQLCAFAAWNGSKGDRGGRKSISDWVELVIK